jgi:hypothetical protein
MRNGPIYIYPITLRANPPPVLSFIRPARCKTKKRSRSAQCNAVCADSPLLLHLPKEKRTSSRRSEKARVHACDCMQNTLPPQPQSTPATCKSTDISAGPSLGGATSPSALLIQQVTFKIRIPLGGI